MSTYDDHTPYSRLIASLEKGEINRRSFYRELRELGEDVRAAHAASVAAALAARRAEAEVHRIAADAYRYSDEWCAEELASTAPGRHRAAKILMTLETPSQRRECVRLAHRFMNATSDAGRWSDALRSCVDEARRMVGS